MAQTLLEAAVKDKLFSNRCYASTYSPVFIRSAETSCCEQVQHP